MAQYGMRPVNDPQYAITPDDVASTSSGFSRDRTKGKAKAKATASEDVALQNSAKEDGVLPTPFTPSINKTLNMFATTRTVPVPPLPKGLTVGNLRTRLEKKTKIK